MFAKFRRFAEADPARRRLERTTSARACVRLGDRPRRTPGLRSARRARGQRSFGGDGQSEAARADDARSRTGTSHAMFVGESGAGKEVLARRRRRFLLASSDLFVPINCAVIPDACSRGAVRPRLARSRGRPTRYRARSNGRLRLRRRGCTARADLLTCVVGRCCASACWSRRALPPFKPAIRPSSCACANSSSR